MNVKITVDVVSWLDYLEGVIFAAFFCSYGMHWNSWKFWVAAVGLKIVTNLIRRLLK